jgi:aerobic carbon-monoxide dehydrogenase large subunit
MALAVSIIMLAIGVAYVVLWTLGPADCATVGVRPHNWTADGVQVDATTACPLRTGEVVTAVDGRELVGNAGTGGWAVGDTVDYTVIRTGRETTARVTLEAPNLPGTLAAAWPTLLFVFALLGVAGYVAWRRPRPATTGLLIFASGLAASSLPTLLGLSTVDVLDPWQRWTYLVATQAVYLAGWSGGLAFVLQFPRRHPRLESWHPKARLVLFTAPLWTVATWGLASATASANLLDWTGRLISGTSLAVVAVVLLMIGVALSWLRSGRDALERQQMRWLVGTGVLTASTGLAGWFLPEVLLGQGLPTAWIGLSGLPFVLGLGVALLRYRLFDLDVVLNRGLVYGLLTAGIATVYIVAVAAAATVMHGDVTTPASIVATVVVAVAVNPLRVVLQRGIDRMMYGDRDDPYSALSRLDRRLDDAGEADSPVIHEELGDNLCFARELETDGFSEVWGKADLVVERDFRFPRHTGVCLEGRSVVGDWLSTDRRLTVYISHQAPNMVQDCFARLLGLPESAVRVICRDVGGSFGIKTHVYGDELATCALSMMLGRPVKFVADRLESFVSDIHSRDHRVTARMAVTREGKILGLDFVDRLAVGPYSVYPRGSAVEGNQICNITGQWYKLEAYRARIRTAFTNMAPYSNYRAVGHPIAVGVAEGMVDAAARELGADPVEIRRKNLIPDDAFPFQAASGIRFEVNSHHRCLDKLTAMMDYEALRREQRELRASGRYRGIGIASMIEITNPSAMFYGVGGVRVSAQDGCTVKMEPGGGIVVLHGCGEQGQGTETIYAQIAADAIGVPFEQVRLVTGDTEVTPYGGGTWASRGAGVGGEATWQSARALRTNILELAALVTQSDVSRLDIVDGKVIDAKTGDEKISLAECGRIAFFRPDTLDGYQPELCVTRHFVPKQFPFCFTNGVMACHLEVDTNTGMIDLLKFWAVEDCGTVLNPQLVDEQIRGGIVHGIGPTLYEECLYDGNGQMLNANMADYLVPMSFEMPDMEIGHVVTPTRESELGAKGAGEAGTAGAPAAIMNALNDALSSLEVSMTDMPFTPQKVLKALGKV